MREYIYVLKLKQAYHDEKSWTKVHHKIIEDHFMRLKKQCEEGLVVTAGKTDAVDEKGFGIVVFQADNEEEAQEFMREDPAVLKGMMTAEVFPYRTALLKK